MDTYKELYLPLNIHQTEFNNRVKLNYVVLVKDPAKSRPFWCLGRVVELFPGDDNNVRSARIRKGDGTCLVNSIKHLYPLELSITHSHQPLHSVDDVDFEGFDLDDIEKSKFLNDKKLNAIAESFEGFELDDIEKSKLLNDKKLNAIAKSFEGFDVDSIEKSKLLNDEKQSVIGKILAKVDENDEVPHQETQKLDKH